VRDLRLLRRIGPSLVSKVFDNDWTVTGFIVHLQG
jgi:hypothetical protein